MTDAPLRRLSELGEVSLAQLRHVGARRLEALHELGVDNVFDLLTFYPRRYVDLTRRVDLADLTVGEEGAVFGEVLSTTARRTRQGRAMVQSRVGEGEEQIEVVFFNQAWRERQLTPGVHALFFGKVGEYRGARQMTNPVVDVVVGAAGEERDPKKIGRLVPVYPTTAKAGLTSWEIGGFVEEALARAGWLFDPLFSAQRERYDLVDRTASYWGIHRPGDDEQKNRARRRLVFDEFLRLQLILALRRQRVAASSAGIRHDFRLADLDGDASENASLVARFLAAHHFSLTSSQRQVLGDIASDLTGALPMHRLLQGDVGSGKTVVALVSMLAVRDGGRQSVLLAPTEVLAEQHVASLRRDLAELTVADDAVLSGRRPLVVELLTGSTRAKDRQRTIEGLASGAVDVVVGTHALLSDDVRFRALGLIVIDEQHRFGVEQRARLRDEGRLRSLEGRDPDVLVMTATPIPRTAALILFGDLDVSVLHELPAGRRPVATSWAQDEDEVRDCWQRVRDEVAAGHRAFVICPLVEGSAVVEAQSAVEERTRLAKEELRGLSLGLLHGQMKPGEKDDVMAQFRAGEITVLVATVVVEVGVDVPNATVIVIEDAWRFGLAQLHQLRGRVGRSDLASYCYLLGTPPNKEGVERLGALVASNDGFQLAEMDLAMRKEGTLLGTRQNGRTDLRLAKLVDDQALLDDAHQLANEIVAEADSSLAELEDDLRLFVDEDEAAYLFRS